MCNRESELSVIEAPKRFRGARFRATAIQEQMDAAAGALETIAVKPKKTNIAIRMFTLAWAPYAKDASGELKPAWE